jgi:wyosine [tRNA(Phe)-imidazoG37] synthetase (radical SAM superfamily)
MEGFSISNVYVENGCNVIDINPLPEDYCSFDCVFCPLGRTAVKTDKMFFFKETKEFINRLREVLHNNKVDIVFINPDGELIDVIRLIKKFKRCCKHQ